MSDDRTTSARQGREVQLTRDGAEPYRASNRIAVIRARVREGSYDADAVLEATAREIIARRDL